MNSEIKIRIVQEIQKVLNLPASTEEVVQSNDLKVLGMNSITFIKCIVAIESAFEIEFGDEDLDMSRFKDLDSLATYTEERCRQS